MNLAILLSPSPPHAHLVLAGELDAFEAIALRHRLDEALDAGCTHFTVDATDVTFIDAGGLGALVRLRNAVRAVGGDVEMSAASWIVRWVADTVGLSAAFGLERCVRPRSARAGSLRSRRSTRPQSYRPRPA